MTAEMTMTDDELREWQRAKRVTIETEANPMADADFGRRGKASQTQPSDYRCHVCGEAIPFHLKAPGPMISLWSREDCACERERREKSETAAAIAEQESVRNREEMRRAAFDKAFTLTPAQREVRFTSMARFESDQMRAAGSILFNWCRKRIADASVTQGLMLSSVSVGCGKTHLLLAAANELHKGGVGVHFTEVGSLLERIRAEQREEQKTLRMASRIPVLILDDLGAPALGTAWQADQLFQILDRRYQAGLPILASTNILDKAHPERRLARLLLAPRDSEFPDREITGARLESRLLALARPVLVSGADLRRR